MAHRRSLPHDKDAHMALTAHLLEFRKRVLLSMSGIALMSIPGWLIYPYALAWLVSPLREASLSPMSGTNFRTVIGPLSTHIYFSFWAGLLLSSPWWISQLWLFIAPALHRSEKRAVYALSIPSTLLFFGGAGNAIAFLPRAVRLLIADTPDGTSTLIDVDSYLRFSMALVIAVALSFLFPVLVVGANIVGLVSVRQLIHTWRWSTLGAFTFAAVVNPLPDAWSMIVQAGALLTLHYCAIGICAIYQWHQRRQARRGRRVRA